MPIDYTWILSQKVFNVLVTSIALFLGIRIVTHLKRSSVGYNERLIPFAYYSLTVWTIWWLQACYHLVAWVLLPTSVFIPSIADWAVLGLQLIQALCIGMAAIALSTKHDIRKWTLPVMLSLVNVLVLFTVLTAPIDITDERSMWVLMLFLDGTMIAAMVALIPVVRRFGLSSWAWMPFAGYAIVVLVMALIPYENELLGFRRWIFPVIRIALLFLWARLLRVVLTSTESAHQESVDRIERIVDTPKFLTKISVMISSTMDDLRQERNAVDNAIGSLHMDRFLAESYGAVGYTSRSLCEAMARDCNVFILLIGERYGHVVQPENISVVELEYSIAKKHDRNKILVYVKQGVEREERLAKFLHTVEDFETGHFRTVFQTPEELYTKVHRDISNWLVQRATRT